MSDANAVNIELCIKFAPERRSIEANMVYCSSTSGTRYKAPMAASQRPSAAALSLAVCGDVKLRRGEADAVVLDSKETPLFKPIGWRTTFPQIS